MKRIRNASDVRAGDILTRGTDNTMNKTRFIVDKVSNGIANVSLSTPVLTSKGKERMSFGSPLERLQPIMDDGQLLVERV